MDAIKKQIKELDRLLDTLYPKNRHCAELRITSDGKVSYQVYIFLSDGCVGGYGETSDLAIVDLRERLTEKMDAAQAFIAGVSNV